MSLCSRAIHQGGSIAFWLGGLVLATTAAQARDEVLRWTHSSPADVQRFEALYGTSSGAFGSPVNLGKPTPNASGVYQASITVGDSQSVYVAVRAIGTTGAVSPLSEERLRAAPPPTDSGTTTTPTFNFEQVSAGTSVPGWVDTGSGFSMAEDDSLFIVTTTVLGGEFFTSSTLADIHSHVARPTPSTTNSYRLRGGMSFESASGGIGVTFYSGYPTRDAYYRLGRLPGETFKLSARHGMTCSLLDSGMTPTAGGSYGYEISIQTLSDRNRIEAKVWSLREAEPAAPQIRCDDTASGRPTTGTIGVWATGAGTKYWDNFVLDALVTSLPAPPSTTIAPPVLIQIVPVN